MDCEFAGLDAYLVVLSWVAKPAYLPTLFHEKWAKRQPKLAGAT